MSEEFSFRDWASEGVEGVRSKMKVESLGGDLLPEAFRSHMKASRKEFLLAFRSLLDGAIRRIDEAQGLHRQGSTIKPE
jgi:hypothetical protein